jgi:hypothetical protein
LKTQVKRFPHIPLLGLLFLTSLATATAKDWHINPQSATALQDGSAEHPLPTAQAALDLALPGDVIHLHPPGALYRQMLTLRNDAGVTIEGNGVTLTGADPLPVEGWEQVEPGLHRRKLPEPPMKRHLLVFNGKAQRMHRSPSLNTPFPDPHQMAEGEFAWQPIDGETGWLWVRTSRPLAQLEWSVRTAGVATSGSCRDIKIRHLNARHTLNDGFNIHGDCRGLHASKISAYECFDEGFSAHDASQTTVEDSLFWGNDHAIADVNAAETRYLRCEFRDSITVEVLLAGRVHHLEDCRIIASAPSAFTLSPGVDLKAKSPLHTTCLLKNVTVTGVGPAPHSFHSNSDTTLTLDNCTLNQVTVELLGDRPSTQTTLNGKPWP